jgi:mycothiol synthase
MPIGDGPPGYTTRVASLDDREVLAALVNEVNVAEVGFAFTNPEQIGDDLTKPGHDDEDDVVLVADGGSIDGYLSTWRDEPLTAFHQLAFVRPALNGQGLSAWLLRFGEDRARTWVERERPAPPVDLRVSRWMNNEAAARLFAALGYRFARTFHDMRIDLDGWSETVEAPEGIVIRTFDRERDARAVHGTLVEAFDDHWGTNFGPFDAWVHGSIDGSGANFDPGFWFVALDGDQLVGVACCQPSSVSSPDAAHVSDLGVRRAWRGRGIGRALLLTAFAEAKRRGIAAVDLGVDSESLTGATRLYEGVGMRITHGYDHWSKPLLAAP